MPNLLRLLLLMSLHALLATPAVSQAEQRYGAIAYSESSGLFGASAGELSRELAEEAAVAACTRPDCKAKVWFRNACGAIAIGPGGYGTGWGIDDATATRWALQTCGRFSQNCTVRHRACSNPGAGQYAGGQ